MIPRACCSFVPEVLIDHMRDLAPKLLESNSISREYHDKVLKFCGVAERGIEDSNPARKIRDARRDAFASAGSRDIPASVSGNRVTMVYPTASAVYQAPPTHSNRGVAYGMPNFQPVTSQTQSPLPFQGVPIANTAPLAHYVYAPSAVYQAPPTYSNRGVAYGMPNFQPMTSQTQSPLPFRGVPIAYTAPLAHYVYAPSAVTSQSSSPLRGVTVIYAQPVAHYVTQSKESPLQATLLPQSAPSRGYPTQQPWPYPQGPYQRWPYPQGPYQQPWPFPQGPYQGQQHWPYPQGPYQPPAPIPTQLPVAKPTQTAPGEKPIIRIFNCGNREDTKSATEVDIANPPAALKQQVNNIVNTLTSLHQSNYQLYGRNGWDNKGSAYKNYLAYGVNMFNAFWDGSEMVYGDPKDHYGDDGILDDMTNESVVRHEQGHSMNSYKYEGASGAWEEFKADWNHIILNHEYKEIKKPAEAPETEWMIGDALIPDDSQGKKCIRRVDKPGFASLFDVQKLALIDDNPHVGAFVKNAENETVLGDHGGVHIYSAIPSKVFHSTAVELNEPIYGRLAKLLYAVCSDPKAKRDANWQELADAWVAKAKELGYSDIAAMLTKHWAKAGVTISQAPSVASGHQTYYRSYPSTINQAPSVVSGHQTHYRSYPATFTPQQQVQFAYPVKV